MKASTMVSNRDVSIDIMRGIGILSMLFGHCPQELEDIAGYNPCIEIDERNPVGQIKSIIKNITHYQELVDRNRDAALRLAPWELRMRQVRKWLEKI